ncbi:hypothetical protein [Rhizobiales bacterium]|jgi:hypothetical protein|uniref:hypothetical protein n=1 Tax=unclassified Rhizobium TaxID=2613769 RepID=UPI000DE0B256
MHTLTDLLPWILALPPALWETGRVRKTYGAALGAVAGIIVFGGIFLWVVALALVISDLDMRLGPVVVLQALCLLVAPPAVTWWVGRKSSLAAGIFAGIAAGFCLLFVTSVIWLAVEGV